MVLAAVSRIIPRALRFLKSKTGLTTIGGGLVGWELGGATDTRPTNALDGAKEGADLFANLFNFLKNPLGLVTVAGIGLLWLTRR